MNKNIIICADDFALNAAVSKGIVNLANNKRISATSCMTNMPSWVQHSQLLKPLLSKIDIGLHFNLTEGSPLSNKNNSISDPDFFSLNHLISKAYRRQLIKAKIKTELNAQINAFSVQMGCMPAFIDGHQHIQQLPIIREAIVEVYRALNLWQYNTYLRVSSNGFFASFHQPQKFKAVILALLGANKFRRLLVANKIPHNTSFSGIYNFAKDTDYPVYFTKFLQQLKNNGILMCHPGLPASDHNDAIAAARSNEYIFFNGTNLQQICTAANVSIGKFLSKTK